MPLPIPTLLQRSLYVLVLALFALSCDENKVEAPQTFTVTFDTDGGSTVESLIVTKDEKASKPTDPKKEGFTFVDWYTDEATTQAYDFTAPVTADIILYAKWAETFTVSFNTNGGSAVASLTVTKDGKVDPPDNPTKEGYAFEGWCTDEATTQAYDFTTTTVTATITLYAKWGEKLVSIPDANFRAALKEKVSAAFEGELMDRTHSSVLSLTSLDVASNSIYSLAGIEYFTALISLTCSNNALTELDVRQNTALISLTCSNNALTALDVTQNTALTRLTCVTNELSSLDLRGLKNLQTLEIDARSSDGGDAAINPITQLYIHTALQTHDEIKEAKTNRDNLLTISTYDDANTLVCSNFNPHLREAGMCITNKVLILDENFRTALKENVSAAFDGEYMDTTHSSVLNLLSLDVRSKSIYSLEGVEYFTALIELNCSSNSLTELDVTQNTALTTLYCNDNALTALDVTQNTALRYLYCQGNLLTRLDLRGRQRFNFLRIDAGSPDDAGTATNPLTELYVHTALQTHSEVREVKTNRGADVTISTYDDANTLVCANFDPTEGMAGACFNMAQIPDANFRAYLKTRIGDAFEGELIDRNHSSVLGLRSLDVTEKSIASLEGIEYFTALTSLDCSNNSLATLDVTRNTALTELDCASNELTTLDVTQNTALIYLYCQGNLLTRLDVTQNTALTVLRCGWNSLAVLDLTRNTALIELYCYNNLLTALDVRQNTALTWLGCFDNLLTALDVTQNTALTTLRCHNNSLTALDVTSNTALRSLYCQGNLLTRLDVTQNTALIYLYCQGNLLTRLDVTQNTALESLTCSNNSLTALDVTQNTALTRLLCGGNQLTVLDVSSSTALIYLSCWDNQLTSLTLSNNTALRSLYCQGNQLTRLDLRGLKSFTRLVIDAGVSVDGTEQNPLEQLYVHTALQTHSEVREVKTNRGADVTISTYDDANKRVCADFDPTEGTAGTCKD